ncbi:MAG: electron transport complex subunit E [Halieaceae bacterium]|jgi:Na+-translocating ferredoxin:NAD+ oxidoreductase subunit E|nr:electron transport complex subunit E [Halieaceae bacterium]
MADTDYKMLTRSGLWKNNPAIVQLLGLCPLLAVTGSVVNAIGLAIATTFVLVGSGAAVSAVRQVLSDAIRLPVFVMIIAAAVTCIELLMQAFAYELYQILGIFLPLITTNCIILGRAESFASRNPMIPAIYDGFIMGIGFSLVLILLGGLREVIGTGVLFADMDLLFGPSAADWEWVLVESYQPFLLAILPPGAFIFAGLIIAVKNLIDIRIEKRRDRLRQKPVKGARRVRVTGKIS